jgi:DNA-3-methyladenine glycosylase I
MTSKRRCAWAEGNALHEAYHDAEWGVPIHDSRELWELLMLEGFQAGLAWIVVLRKREALRTAFKQFNPEKVARFTQRDVQRLLKNEAIIRSRAKINATIDGARIWLKMRAQGEDFATWIWNFAGGKPIQRRGPVAAQTPLSVEISKALKKKGFKFVGPVIVYAFMQAAGLVNDHAPHCFRRKAVATLR